MRKRILSILLAITMVTGLLPSFTFTALAAEPGYDVVTETVTPDIDLPDNDELFAMYAEQKLYGCEMSTFGAKARAGLNSVEQAIY